MIRIGTVIDAAPVGHAVTVMLEGETEYSLAWAKGCIVAVGDRVVCDTAGTSLIVLANLEPPPVSPLAGVKAFEIQSANFVFTSSNVSAAVTVTFSTAFANAAGTVYVLPGVQAAWTWIDVRTSGIYSTHVGLVARKSDGGTLNETIPGSVLLVKL